MSKKLSNIHIIIREADQAQQKAAVLALSEKYGAPFKYNPEKGALFIAPDVRLHDTISDTQFFAPDKQNIIAVRYTAEIKKSLIIIYNNISLTKQEHAEAETFKQYFKTRFRQQDKDRM